MKFGIGQSAPRVEDRRLTTGRGRYTDDISLPRQARAALLRSPYPNARIRSIDTQAATQVVGVLEVVTGADIVAAKLGPLPSMTSNLPLTRADGSKAHVPAWWPLAFEQVRFVGDGVAMVVAETQAAAREAADLIEVDYEPLEAVTDIVRSSATGSASVWGRVRRQRLL